jgi:hypothetical protein
MGMLKNMAGINLLDNAFCRIMHALAEKGEPALIFE